MNDFINSFENDNCDNMKIEQIEDLNTKENKFTNKTFPEQN